MLGAVHWYLYRRLVEDVSPPGGPWRRIGAVLLILLWVTAASVMFSGPDGSPFGIVRTLSVPGYRWLPVLLALTGALLLAEIVRALLLRRRSPGGEAAEGEAADPSRRRFVARGVAVGAATLAGAFTYAESMDEEPPSQKPGTRGVELLLPFTGRWLARNSPARRVPSHGTDLFGGRYAIDFIGVDEHRRTARSRSWRTLFTTEPPDIFLAFGQPVLAPVDGTVVHVHDGETDHESRRSQLALLPYALGQAGRARQGVNALAGNHIVIEHASSGTFVLLAHLKKGSQRVTVGRRVAAGEHIADCGNSGNSTQPHVHMQVTDGADMTVARGVPMVFRRFREWPSGTDGANEAARTRDRGMPDEGTVVESLAAFRQAQGN
ncbi:M23 family metallopeptidase [Streptomyces sp. TR06-5]|uniref:M23 family metallopeptidase n=1 Tax=Streptomyces sp. TR06-5 TaxID=3385976 RepID=UPI0039A21408